MNDLLLACLFVCLRIIITNKDLGATIPIPYQRPCKNVCDVVNPLCMGLLPLLGIVTGCSDKFDWYNKY